MKYLSISKPIYETGENGEVNELTFIRIDGADPILLVETIYETEDKAPIDEETGKPIREKIEWQDQKTRKCYQRNVLRTW